ncbi:MAG: hypothetical protein NTW19_20640 [Planctomycetota bacterium]|nr:hypothetical protein [Planctomycetota bacterium]
MKTLATLRVREDAGLDRHDDVLTWGVPLAQGLVTNAGNPRDDCSMRTATSSTSAPRGCASRFSAAAGW